MTDNIKELANLPVTLLAVTETNVHLQTESGKGVMTLTSADLSSGGGSTVATVDNVVMEDHDTGVLYFLRTTSDTPPVISYYTLAGVAYTPTNAALDLPYGVATVTVSGSVEVTNYSGTAIPVSGTITANAGTNLNTSDLATSANQTNGTQQTQITDGAGTVNTKQIGTALTSSDVALVSQAVIHGLSTAGGGAYVDVKVNPSGSIQVSPDVTFNTGNADATTQRVVLASDQPAVAITSVDIGAKADTPATTDSGTFSLIALFKRLLAKLTALISTQTIVASTEPQVVAIGNTSIQSAAVNANTSRIILTSTVDCWVVIGANPTAVAATAGSLLIPAGLPSYIRSVNAGDKIAVIQNTSSGYLSIDELL